MKFLIDAQLPVALARYLRSLGQQASHVADLGMTQADDDSIWRRAVRESEIILTKDEDFALRRILATSGPQVVWLRFGNCSNRSLMAQLAPLWSEVETRLAAGDVLVEVV